MDWFKGKSSPETHGFLASNIGVACRFSRHPILFGQCLAREIPVFHEDPASFLAREPQNRPGLRHGVCHRDLWKKKGAPEGFTAWRLGRN